MGAVSGLDLGPQRVGLPAWDMAFPLWTQNRPGCVRDSTFIYQPMESSYRGSWLLFWDIKNT